MQAKTLLKLSLIISVIGIFTLLLIIEKIEIKNSDISNISNYSLDQKVKVKGFISSVKNLPGILILTLRDNSGEITVIVFKEEEIELKKDMLIEVEGTLKEYKGKLEIEADKIKVFK